MEESLPRRHRDGWMEDLEGGGARDARPQPLAPGFARPRRDLTPVAPRYPPRTGDLDCVALPSSSPERLCGQPGQSHRSVQAPAAAPPPSMAAQGMSTGVGKAAALRRGARAGLLLLARAEAADVNVVAPPATAKAQSPATTEKKHGVNN